LDPTSYSSWTDQFGGDIDGCSSTTETLTSAANGDLRASTPPLRFNRMGDLETIDSELRLLAAVRRVCREYDGRVPSITLVDELLDEHAELTGN
jgi:hypothetical protein